MLDVFLSVLDRMASLPMCANKPLRNQFEDMYLPMFHELLSVHKDYLAMFRMAQRFPCHAAVDGPELGSQAYILEMKEALENLRSIRIAFEPVRVKLALLLARRSSVVLPMEATEFVNAVLVYFPMAVLPRREPAPTDLLDQVGYFSDEKTVKCPDRKVATAYPYDFEQYIHSLLELHVVKWSRVSESLAVVKTSASANSSCLKPDRLRWCIPSSADRRTYDQIMMDRVALVLARLENSPASAEEIANRPFARILESVFDDLISIHHYYLESFREALWIMPHPDETACSKTGSTDHVLQLRRVLECVRHLMNWFEPVRFKLGKIKERMNSTRLPLEKRFLVDPVFSFFPTGEIMDARDTPTKAIARIEGMLRTDDEYWDDDADAKKKKCRAICVHHANRELRGKIQDVICCQRRQWSDVCEAHATLMEWAEND